MARNLVAKFRELYSTSDMGRGRKPHDYGLMYRLMEILCELAPDSSGVAEVTHKELVEYSEASKSSVRTGLRMLEEMGFVRQTYLLSGSGQTIGQMIFILRPWEEGWSHEESMERFEIANPREYAQYVLEYNRSV